MGLLDDAVQAVKSGKPIQSQPQPASPAPEAGIPKPLYNIATDQPGADPATAIGAAPAAPTTTMVGGVPAKVVGMTPEQANSYVQPPSLLDQATQQYQKANGTEGASKAEPSSEGTLSKAWDKLVIGVGNLIPEAATGSMATYRDYVSKPLEKVGRAIEHAGHEFGTSPAELKTFMENPAAFLPSAYGPKPAYDIQQAAAEAHPTMYGVGGGIGSVSASLLDPENLAVMAAMPEAEAYPILSKLSTKAFAGMMTSDSVKDIKNLADNWGNMTSAERSEALTKTTVQTALAALTLYHATHGEPKVKTETTDKRTTVRPTTETRAGVPVPVTAAQQESPSLLTRTMAKFAKPGEKTKFQQEQTIPAARNQATSILGQRAYDKIEYHNAIANGEAPPPTITGSQVPSGYEHPDEMWPAMQDATQQTWDKVRDASNTEQEAWQRARVAAEQSHQESIDHYNELVGNHNADPANAGNQMERQTFDPSEVDVPERPKTFDELKAAVDAAGERTGDASTEVRQKARDIELPKAEKALDAFFKEHEDVVSKEEYESAKKLWSDSERFKEIAASLRPKLVKETLNGQDIRGLESTVDGKAVRRRGKAGLGEFQRLLGPEAYDNLQQTAKLFDPLEKTDPRAEAIKSWGLFTMKQILGGGLGYALGGTEGVMATEAAFAGQKAFTWLANKVMFDPEFGSSFGRLVDAVKSAFNTGVQVPGAIVDGFKKVLARAIQANKEKGEAGVVGAAVKRANVGPRAGAKPLSPTGTPLPKEWPSDDKLVEKYGEASDPAQTAFLLTDGRKVKMPLGSEHDRMLGGKPTDDFRTPYVNETGNIRMRAYGVYGDRQFGFSLPKEGITEQQLDEIKKWGPQLRTGRVFLEQADPEGKNVVLHNATNEQLEEGIRSIVPVKEKANTSTDFKPAEHDEYSAAVKANPQAATLSDPDQMKGNKIYSNGEGVYYSVSPEGDLQGVVNNSGKKGALAGVVPDAIKNGAKTLDAWDIYLPKQYEKYGFERTTRVPYDVKAYGEPSTELKDAWKQQGWKEGDPYPAVQYMRLKGTGEAAEPKMVRNGQEYFSVQSPEGKLQIHQTGKNSAVVQAVDVAEESQRKGIATALYEKAKEELLSRGITTLGGSLEGSGPLQIREKVFGPGNTKYFHGGEEVSVEEARKVMDEDFGYIRAQTNLRPEPKTFAGIDLSADRAATDQALKELADGKITRDQLLSRAQELKEVAKAGPDLASKEIATRIPTVKNADLTNNPDITRGIDAINEADKNRPTRTVPSSGNVELGVKQTIANALAGYEGSGLKFTPEELANPDAVIEKAVEHYKGNLKALYDAMPAAIRDVAHLWYDSAHELSKKWANQYGLLHEQVAGVIAALSPKNPWDNNAGVAERLIKTWKENRNHAWSKKMDAKLTSIANAEDTTPKFRNMLMDIRGKRYSQLSKLTDDPKELRGYQGIWLRMVDEAHGSDEVPLYSPDGEIRGSTRRVWGMPDPIAKAIDILENGDIQHIHEVMGGGNKIRNFYNNIINPNSERGHVTIDTHAVGAAHMKPFSQEDEEVKNNFGGNATGKPGAGSEGKSGVKGTYHVYEEAYRRAAKELGIQPRELQSITWEGIRSLISENDKGDSSFRNDIDDIWRQHEDGKISVEDARNQIIERSGGFKKPEWATDDQWNQSESGFDTSQLQMAQVGSGDTSIAADITPVQNPKLARWVGQPKPSVGLALDGRLDMNDLRDWADHANANVTPEDMLHTTAHEIGHGFLQHLLVGWNDATRIALGNRAVRRGELLGPGEGDSPMDGVAGGYVSPGTIWGDMMNKAIDHPGRVKVMKDYITQMMGGKAMEEILGRDPAQIAKAILADVDTSKQTLVYLGIPTAMHDAMLTAATDDAKNLLLEHWDTVKHLVAQSVHHYGGEKIDPATFHKYRNGGVYEK